MDIDYIVAHMPRPRNPYTNIASYEAAFFDEGTDTARMLLAHAGYRKVPCVEEIANKLEAINTNYIAALKQGEARGTYSFYAQALHDWMKGEQ